MSEGCWTLASVSMRARTHTTMCAHTCAHARARTHAHTCTDGAVAHGAHGARVRAPRGAARRSPSRDPSAWDHPHDCRASSLSLSRSLSISLASAHTKLDCVAASAHRPAHCVLPQYAVQPRSDVCPLARYPPGRRHQLNAIAMPAPHLPARQTPPHPTAPRSPHPARPPTHPASVRRTTRSVPRAHHRGGPRPQRDALGVCSPPGARAA